jgi:16S rRNA (cytidine1402-2'-O)-methyltransferase
MPGTLFVVATPIGNLEDITARALRILREVALIAAEDTRRTSHLLSRYSIDTPTTSLHEHNEHRKTTTLVDRLKRGESIALVSDAGTPAVSDPGRYLIRTAIAAGIRVEPIPGPSAVMAALAASGLESDAFTFLGFPPIRSKDRTAWFERLRTSSGTVVFFEAPHRIQSTLTELLGKIGDRPGAICRELTKIHETVLRGPISELLASSLETHGELTIVIDVGLMPNLPIDEPASERDLAIQFGEITESEGLTKRKAINVLARRHGRSPNEVYKAVERGKKLV